MTRKITFILAGASALAILAAGPACAGANTSLQWGVDRTVTPWLTCVYDSSNICQPVFGIPSGGGAITFPNLSITAASSSYLGPSGLTRTVQSKLSDTIDVIDYGAVGDGASHPLSSKYTTLAAAQAVYPFATSLTQELDWAATQAATNAAIARGAGTVRFSGVGAYLFSDTVTCGTSSFIPLTFVGDEQRTLIRNTSSVANATFNCSNSVFETNSLIFKNLFLTTPATTTAGNLAFNVVNSQAVTLDNVYVYGYYQGLKLDRSWAPVVRNGSYFQAVKDAAIFAVDSSFKGATISGSTFAGNGNTTNVCAILVGPSNGLSFSGNDFSTNYCHVQFNNTNGVSFTGNYLETTTAGSFVFVNTSGASSAIEVTGNTFENDVGANAVKYVAGFNFANNDLYASSWTFDATATKVTGLGSNHLASGATVGAPVANQGGSPWQSSDGVSTSAVSLKTSGAGTQEIPLTIENPNTGPYSSAVVTLKAAGANRVQLFAQQLGSSLGGNLFTYTTDTGGTFRLAQTLDEAQNIRAGGKLMAAAAAPVLSACGGGTPAVSAGSSSNGGQITIGTGATTDCTATFATAYPNYAYCTITPASAYTGTYYVSASSKTAFTFHLGTGTASAVFNYTCSGN